MKKILICNLLIVLVLYFYIITNRLFSFSKLNNSLLFLILNILLIFLLIISVLILFLKKKNINLYIIIMIFLLSITSFTALYNSCYKTSSYIFGTSMEPTFEDNEKVYVTYSESFERNDIIAFLVNNTDYVYKPFSNMYFIKRIIGMPRDTVKWIDGVLYVNEKVVEEDYISTFIETSDFYGEFAYIIDGIEYKTFIIPDGFVFVLGDNRGVNNGVNNSLDSREIGLVPIKNIVGEIN